MSSVKLDMLKKTGQNVIKNIVFSQHAEMKFEILEEHGFPVDKNLVISTMEKPQEIDRGYKGRKIAQKIIDERHVLRVVYEDLPDRLRVITFYPGRRERYEGKV